MAAGHLKDIVETLGREKIEALIPHELVEGKQNGQREPGGILFDMRVEAGGLEAQLDELKDRFSDYLQELETRLAAEFDCRADKAVYLFDRSREDDPNLLFVFSNKSALESIRLRHFVSDCRALSEAPAKFEAIAGRERGPAVEFLERAHDDIMATFNPKIVKFRKKMKVVLSPRAFADLKRLHDDHVN